MACLIILWFQPRALADDVAGVSIPLDTSEAQETLPSEFQDPLIPFLGETSESPPDSSGQAQAEGAAGPGAEVASTTGVDTAPNVASANAWESESTVVYETSSVPEYESARYSGSRSTNMVLELLERLGMSPADQAKFLAPFPVAGPAWYGDDWGAPRYVPRFHFHEGTDIFAPKGTPVIASEDGQIVNLVSNSMIGGNSLRVTTSDSTFYYYSHLDGFAPFLANGSMVRAGEVIGYVGNTGNAEGTLPHLHFEIHPQGGHAVPPVPYLDEWLAGALGRARTLVFGTPWPPEVVEAATAPAAIGPALPVRRTVIVSPDFDSIPAADLGSLAPLALGYGMWRLVRRRRALQEALA